MKTPTIVPRRFHRVSVDDPTTHLFELGQAVRLNNGLSPSANVYRITAKLPPIGDSPQYRIQNEIEKFERMAMQSNLEPVVAGEAASLGEKTFAPGAKPQSASLLSPQVEAAIRSGVGIRRAE
jgi:hypothetical protein